MIVPVTGEDIDAAFRGYDESNSRAITNNPPISSRWPKPLDEAAFHGPAGEFVRIVRPHTESDDAALLTQFLAAVGIWAQPHVYRRAEGAEHPARLNVVVVGQSSGGRKGSAASQVRRFLKLLDSEFTKNRILSGLSSGEGMINAVRDPVVRKEPIREKGRATGEFQMVEVDSGVEDKRALVIEAEFAQVLKCCERESNTLSTLIRQAWDSGDLGTLTKNSPTKASGAHIGIIGHITNDELLRALSTTEAANGFANRFLWVCARRSKELPHGGRLNDHDFDDLAFELGKVQAWALERRELQWSEDAGEAWTRAYHKLSAGRAGLLGSVLRRAEAQVLRLSVLYALLDCSATIEVCHLEAALAVWEYSEQSAEYIFGDKLGDDVADTILIALRANSDGKSRTEINELFSRNVKSSRIDLALDALAKAHLAEREKVATAGRPVERWIASDQRR